MAAEEVAIMTNDKKTQIVADCYSRAGSNYYDLFINNWFANGAPDQFREEYGNMMSKLNLRRGNKVLVFGIGNGAGLELLPPSLDLKITGIDIAEGMLNLAREATSKYRMFSIDLHKMDVANMNFEDNRFDAAYGIFVLSSESRAKADEALNELSRVIKPNGRLSIVDYNRSRIPSVKAEQDLFPNGFTIYAKTSDGEEVPVVSWDPTIDFEEAFSQSPFEVVYKKVIDLDFFVSDIFATLGNRK